MEAGTLPFKCVAFDIDGTLIDTARPIVASFRQALLEETGRAYKEEELHWILGIPGPAALERLGVQDVEAVLRRWDTYAGQYDYRDSIFPGIVELLAGLRDAGVTLGLVTSRTRAEFDRDFVPLGLMEHFRAAVCADDVERPKPNPDPLLKLMADTGFGPGEVLYVGDTLYDSQCARAAGVPFALALWGALDPTLPCDYPVAHPADLLHLATGARRW